MGPTAKVRLTNVISAALVGALVGALLMAGLPAAAGERVTVPISPELAAELDAAAPGDPLVVLVTGDSARSARAAVEGAGLGVVEIFDQLGVVAAVGDPDAVRAVHVQPGVIRVDANTPLEFLDDVAHHSTGVAQLRDTKEYPQLHALRRTDGTAYDGTGVTIAVVDADFDPTHEQFVEGGETKFDVHLRQGCPTFTEFVHYSSGGVDVPHECSQWLPLGSRPDPVGVQGGHGTIVAGVAAGYARSARDDVQVSGTAPGARLAGLSVSAGAPYNIVSAFNWILENHADPCGDGSCPPIRVVNTSLGVPADADGFERRFEPDAPISRATTALVEEGVVVVFAAANSGGNGNTARTNYLGLNPLPGNLLVGAYHDANSGDPDMLLWYSSSRGKKGDLGTYPDLVAPGADITTGCASATFNHCAPQGGPTGTYGTFTGTSLAAPYVSGIVAQLFDADPSLTPAEVEDVLEDTAHQLGRSADLEPDIYQDSTGKTRGNRDHLTSFDAGHGNVDTVAALGRILRLRRRTAPDVCAAKSASVSFADPTGDEQFPWHQSDRLPGHDIVKVRASIEEVPGALSVVLSYRDLPEVPDVPLHTTVVAALDRGGVLGSDVVPKSYAEVDIARTAAGDSFTVFTGDVRVEGDVDPDADTITVVIRPGEGPLSTRATLMRVWTSAYPVGTLLGDWVARVDDTMGACTLWVDEKRKG